MKTTIIIEGRNYFYTDGTCRKSITKSEAEKLFRSWKQAGKEIHRNYALGGRVLHVWTIQ